MGEAGDVFIHIQPLAKAQLNQEAGLCEVQTGRLSWHYARGR